MDINIGISSVVRPVGQNPEASDMCNPSGTIYKEVFFVTAFVEGGCYEYSHYHLFDEAADATALANKIRYEAWKNGWTPVNNQYWTARKIYGAQSWGADDEAGLMDDEEKEHFFTGR